jgi:hypothetical protein
LVPSLRDSVPFCWAYPGLTSGAIVCRPFRDWGWVVWAASSPHATSLRTFVPVRNPQVAQAEYMGPSSGEERPPQDDKVLYGSGRGPGASVGELRSGQSATYGFGRVRRGVGILRSTSRDRSSDAGGRRITRRGYERTAARLSGNTSLLQSTLWAQGHSCRASPGGQPRAAVPT